MTPGEIGRILLFSAGIAGCSSLPPAPKETLIPVPTPCLTRDQIPAGQFITDPELAALTDGELVLALRTDQLSLRQWKAEASAVLEACIR